MKHLFWIFALFFISGSLFAQQIPLNSLMREHAFVVNPAISGTQDHGIANASYRQQWTKIEGAPKTFSASYSMPIYKKNFGIGGHVVNDITGPTSFTGINVSASYHIDFAKINPFYWARFLKKSKLSFGLSASMFQYRLNSNELLLDQPNDNAINSGRNSRFLPNVGAGMYYYYDNFYIGYSVPSILPLNVNFDGGQTISNLKREVHHYIVLGGKIPLGKAYKPTIVLDPIVWFKYVKGAPFQIDGSLRMYYKDIFWIGAGFRSSLTVLADAGVIIKKQFRIGYAYDQQVSDVMSFIGTTHEVFISYHLPTPKKWKR